MAVDITIDGKPFWNAGSYTVTEDSTPIDPSDSTGGVGQFTFDLPEDVGSKTLRGKTATLSDGTQGTTGGIIRSASGDGATATITADSRLSALMVTRTAQPYVGTLEGVFRNYLALADVTTGIVVDATIAGNAVVFPGWSGVVWDAVKRVAASQQVEVSLVSNNIVLRPLRGRIAQNYRDASVAWAIDASNLAQTVEIFYYSNVSQTGALTYPLGGWDDSVQVYQVGASEKQVFDIPLQPATDENGVGASLTSIQQPVCVSAVARDYVASSVYAVSGNDGLIVPPAEWAAGGGSIVVAVNPDTVSLNVTITGSSETQYAPYRIMIPSDTGAGYSSLRLVGSGVFSNRKKITLHTGLNADVAPTVVGATVDDPFFSTYAEAMAAGTRMLGNYGAPRQTLSVTTTGINRKGDTGSYKYSTLADANAEYRGMTLSQVNALWPGSTIAPVDAFWKAKTQGDFENQAFGNVAGARVLNDGMWYRIRSAPSGTPSTIQYTAERDVIASDLNAAYSGKTLAQVNAIFTGAAAQDFNVRPIRSA